MRRALEARGAVAIVIALGLALHAPALRVGWLADDYVQRLVLGEVAHSESLGPLDLYAFGSSGDDSAAHAVGGLLWWTSPEWKVRFARPLTSASLWLDARLFGDEAWPSQLENLALFGLLLALLAGLLRRLGLPAAAVTAAVAIVAAGESSVVPVGWVANRNSLLAALCTVAALGVLGPTQRQPRLPALAAACSLALLAALAKESGIIALAVVAWRIALGGGSRRQRVCGMAAPLLVAVALLATWQALGYGTHSRFYPTPLAEPMLVGGRALLLAAAAPLAFATPVPLDLAFGYPWTRLPLAICGLLVWALLAKALRAVASERPRTSALLFGWAAMALAPQALAPPSDRLLFEAAPAAGAMGALVFVQLLSVHKRAALVLGVSALALSGLSLLARFGGLVLAADDGRAQARSALELARSRDAHDVLLLQTPGPLAALASGAALRVETGAIGVRTWPLQMGGRPLAIERLGPHRYALESLGAPWLTAPLEQVFRTPVDPLAPGRRFSEPPFRIELADIAGDGARRLRLLLRPDASGRYPVLATWRDGAVRAVELPAPGQTRTLAPVPSPLPLGS